MSVNVGEVVDGIITDIMNYGVFVKLNDGKNGLVHISEVSKDYVSNINDVLKSGDKVKVKVLAIDEKGKIALSIKRAIAEENNRNKEHLNLTLDDMLSKFLKDSDERQLDLKRNIESKRRVSKRRA